MSGDPYSWRLGLQRFGLGARPGDADRKGDPREAIEAEISAPGAGGIGGPALKSSAEILVDIYADQLKRKMERDLADIERLSRQSMPAPNIAAMVFPAPDPAPAAVPPAMQAVGGAITITAPVAPAMKPPAPEMPADQKAFRADARARLLAAYAAEFGFVERLVAFWSNHFSVSVAKSDIGRGAAGAFEREAIRPHVLGRFADMLKAVEQHPVMLNFLDNAQSIGPNSLQGHNNRQGLNENLAREILELHTMGVGSGYSQNDVTQFAYILTGWTIAGRDARLGPPGTFAFNPNAHEPLAAVLRGRLYMQDGVAQGEAALADLAREPATANHIALKLARHFVADQPDPALVKRLAQVFASTDGDLMAVSRALATDPAAWSAPPTKLRNPWELSIAAYRAFQRPPDDPGPSLNALNLLGMPLWQPGGPNGFSDFTDAWTSPEGMKTRLELATQFAHQLRNAPRPLQMISDILGPAVSEATREGVMRAESEEQAYALLLLSPEFQRR